MYCCQDCKKEFEYVEVVFERHGLSTPPFERVKLCPFCHSDNFSEIEINHCRYCGSKLRDKGEYCSPICRKKGMELKKREESRQEFLKNSPLIKGLKEVEEYNKAHGTNYSYGKYFALKSSRGGI